MKKKNLLVLLLAMGCGSSLHAQQNGKEVLSEPLCKLNRTIDSLSVLATQTRPLIGISTNIDAHRMKANTAYVQSVFQSGGIPYLIPVTDDIEVLRQIISRLDGVVLTGGEDIQPAYYGEEPHDKLEEVSPERDVFDLTILKLATDRNIPILGICRGMQLMNVAFGGTLYQDLPTQHPSAINHRQEEDGSLPTHSVSVVPQSTLAQITGSQQLQVNTFHHQAIHQIAPGFKAVAWSPDSVVEAIEAYPIRPLLGVQFHPEILTVAGDTILCKLFQHLIHQAESDTTSTEI